MNATGHAVYAWSATGVLRTADRLPTGAWTASKTVAGGQSVAGPVAVAIGRGGLAAVAWTTVATRYEPSRLLISLRPAGGNFAPGVEIHPGTVAGVLKLGIDCAGSVTVLWSTPSALYASMLPGAPAPAGACNPGPGTGAWTEATLISTAGVGAAWPELVVNDAGDTLAVWQEGAPGNPTSIGGAFRSRGGEWQAPATISVAGRATWNPRPGLDALGNAVVGYLDGSSMAGPDPTRGRALAAAGDDLRHATAAEYPALAVDDAGNVTAAWLAYDAASGTAVWQRSMASRQLGHRHAPVRAQ